MSHVTMAWIHHERSGNQYSAPCHGLLWGRCSDIMNVLESRLHVKWMWGGGNEVHLTSIYSPQLLKITCASLLPHDIFLPITKSHKDPQSVLPVCVCTVSAAVVAKIVLKSMMHMCQVSSCHLKVRKAGPWKEISSHFDTSQVARMAEQCRAAARAPVGKHTSPLFKHNNHKVGKCLRCWSVLEQDIE